MDQATLNSADWVGGSEGERVAVDLSGESLVVEALSQLARQYLSPDSTGYGVSQSRADTISGKIESGHDSQVCASQYSAYVHWTLTFVADGGLDQGLGRIREETTGKTKYDLASDDACVIGDTGATVADEDSECEDEAENSKDHEGLDTLDEANDQTERETTKNTRERVQARDTRGRLDRLVKSDDQDGVEVVALPGLSDTQIEFVILTGTKRC